MNEPLAWTDGKGNYFDKNSFFPVDDLIPLYTHPVKELHLSLQKSKQTGELLAVTYTDDEHRIVEVLWQKSPVKELTLSPDEIEDCFPDNGCSSTEDGFGLVVSAQFLHDFARAILRKAQE